METAWQRNATDGRWYRHILVDNVWIPQTSKEKPALSGPRTDKTDEAKSAYTNYNPNLPAHLPVDQSDSSSYAAYYGQTTGNVSSVGGPHVVPRGAEESENEAEESENEAEESGSDLEESESDPGEPEEPTDIGAIDPATVSAQLSTATGLGLPALLEKTHINQPPGGDSSASAPANASVGGTLPEDLLGEPIVGRKTTKNYEPLSSDYRLQQPPRAFFVRGRMFAVLFSEGFGETSKKAQVRPKDIEKQERDNVTRVKHGEKVFTQIRRFIVMHPKHSHCYACPISTYGGRGCIKPSVRPEEHAIVFMEGTSPALLVHESEVTKPSIRIRPKIPGTKLHKASRLNYGLVHPIQYNVKVKDLGMVAEECMPDLLRSYWQETNDHVAQRQANMEQRYTYRAQNMASDSFGSTNAMGSQFLSPNFPGSASTDVYGRTMPLQGAYGANYMQGIQPSQQYPMGQTNNFAEQPYSSRELQQQYGQSGASSIQSYGQPTNPSGAGEGYTLNSPYQDSALNNSLGASALYTYGNASLHPPPSLSAVEASTADNNYRPGLQKSTKSTKSRKGKEPRTG